MCIRRPMLAVVSAILLLIGVVGLSPVVVAQKKEEKKRDEAQNKEVQTLVAVVDGVIAGQPPPADVPLSWQHHFLKAQDGKTYVPFTLSFDAAKIPSQSLVVYMRVITRGGAAEPAKPDPEKKDAKEKATPDFAFEDVHFVEVKPPPAGQPQRVSRAFAVPTGDYDVYIAVKERAPSGKSAASTPQKTAVLKEAVSVPNFWAPDLAVSSIIVADRLEPLTAPLTKEQQIDHPYAFGNQQIVPANETTFSKKGELSIIFLIYNTGLDANKKPDVTVEYSFNQKAGGAEKFFNKTAPQAFNAQTLPPQFDTAAGHQIVAGQSIPLASFLEGDYRLEVKVTDKTSGKTITRDVNFTVASA